MNGFQCNMSGAKSTKQLAKPRVARRYVVASIPSSLSSRRSSVCGSPSCGAEPELNLPARPWNCTYGAKSPLYWLQQERCNMFEGYYSPPLYQDLYNFLDGAQNDIFEGSDVQPPSSTHKPSPTTKSSSHNEQNHTAVHARMDTSTSEASAQDRSPNHSSGGSHQNR